MRTAFWLKSLKQRDHLEDLEINGLVNITAVFREICLEVLNFIALVQVRDRCCALVNTVMRFRNA
jgi:hypothetical protein